MWNVADALSSENVWSVRRAHQRAERREAKAEAVTGVWCVVRSRSLEIPTWFLRAPLSSTVYPESCGALTFQARDRSLGIAPGAVSGRVPEGMARPPDAPP